jgi:transcription antitermination factor NusG
MERQQWFVMCAYKNEKKAEMKLGGKDGLEYFIPKCYAVRIYHGKKRKELVPIIPNLVFVHASRMEIQEFKKKHKILQYVMWEKSTGTDFVVVPDKQMEDFMKLAGRYEESVVYYKPEEINLQKGTRVRIHGGAFDGVEGVFVKVRGARSRRVVVLLEGIMAVTSAEISSDLIEILS